MQNIFLSELWLSYSSQMVSALNSGLGPFYLHKAALSDWPGQEILFDVTRWSLFEESVAADISHDGLALCGSVSKYTPQTHFYVELTNTRHESLVGEDKSKLNKKRLSSNILTLTGVPFGSRSSCLVMMQLNAANRWTRGILGLCSVNISDQLFYQAKKRGKMKHKCVWKGVLRWN